jgi:hypothetical protein
MFSFLQSPIQSPKAPGTAALQDAPATRQTGLAKLAALGSFSLREKVAEGRMRVKTTGCFHVKATG